MNTHQSQSGVGLRVGGGSRGVRESGGGKMETTVLEQYKEHITDRIQLGIYNKFNFKK